MDAVPAGRRLTGTQVQRIAERNPVLLRAQRRHPGSYPNVYTKGPARWQVEPVHARQAGQGDRPALRRRRDRARSPRRGPASRWRGRWRAATRGAFGRKINSPWVWIPLTIAFLVPFVDPRRPLRMLHLDVLVLAAFGISVAFFNDAQIGISVPLVYPLLVYLLGAHAVDRPAPRHASARAAAAAPCPSRGWPSALVFLLGFRVGAERHGLQRHRRRLRGRHRRRPDRRRRARSRATSRPTTSTATPTARSTTPPTCPFEQVAPVDGALGRPARAPTARRSPSTSPCLVLLFLLGRRVRGPDLGIVLAYAGRPSRSRSTR